MDDKERYERGMARRRKVLGQEWVDRANANKTAFNEEFQDFITRSAWGEIWTRPHYDERTRRILVIGTMLALDKWDEFRMHVRAALSEGGFTTDEVRAAREAGFRPLGFPTPILRTPTAIVLLAALGLVLAGGRGEDRGEKEG